MLATNQWCKPNAENELARAMLRRRPLMPNGNGSPKGQRSAAICSICVRLCCLAGSPARGGKFIGRGGAPAQPLCSARPSVQAPLGAAECCLAENSTQIITDLEGFFICSICSICVRLCCLAGSPARGGKCIGRGGALAQPLCSAHPSIQAPLGAAECCRAGDSTQNAQNTQNNIIFLNLCKSVC